MFQFQYFKIHFQQFCIIPLRFLLYQLFIHPCSRPSKFKFQLLDFLLSIHLFMLTVWSYSFGVICQFILNVKITVNFFFIFIIFIFYDFIQDFVFYLSEIFFHFYKIMIFNPFILKWKPVFSFIWNFFDIFFLVYIIFESIVNILIFFIALIN